VNACIADALHFGDLDDPASNVSCLLREQRSFRMHAELGTEPGFHYVYSRSFGTDLPASPPAAPPAASQLRTRGVEPWHQQHWDWKAASNFICGGAGSGLFAFAALASLRHVALYPLALFALAIVACGLLLLLFKIGRPRRFI